MLLIGLTPTYGRPRHILENALACFEHQTHEERRLLLCDDGGRYFPQSGDRWELLSTKRFPSLPAKYDWMVAEALKRWPDAAGFVVLDDDDIIAPRHFENHAAALAEHGWSHPREVWSTYTGRPLLELAAGRFHGSLAVRLDFLRRVHGWRGVMPHGRERQADFDQRMIAALHLLGPPGRPDELDSPTYVFRWGSTGAGHCQGLMRTPDDETWYERVLVTPDAGHAGPLVPTFDADTLATFDRILGKGWQG